MQLFQATNIIKHLYIIKLGYTKCSQQYKKRPPALSMMSFVESLEDLNLRKDLVECPLTQAETSH